MRLSARGNLFRSAHQSGEWYRMLLKARVEEKRYNDEGYRIPTEYGESSATRDGEGKWGAVSEVEGTPLNKA